MFGSNETEAQEQASSDEKGPGLPALRQTDQEEGEMRAAAATVRRARPQLPSNAPLHE